MRAKGKAKRASFHMEKKQTAAHPVLPRAHLPPHGEQAADILRAACDGRRGGRGALFREAVRPTGKRPSPGKTPAPLPRR